MERKRLIALAVLLFALLILLSAAALAFGSVQLSAERIISAFKGEDNTARVIIFGLRLPRLLAAALAGVGLATAGCILQAVTDNGLCAPNTVGVNSGAGFAVMLTLSIAPSLWRFLPLTAFIGALAATAIVLWIARYGGGSQKNSIILAGVAVSALLGAGINFLSLRYPDVLSSYAAFSAGGFSGVKADELAVPAVMIAAGFVLALFLSPKISLLALGDDGAANLGVKVRALRVVSVAVASALCAAVVSFAGLLGFVGLILPHAARRLTGRGLRVCIPYAAAGGAALCILSDLLGRTLFAPSELPAGIIMAFIGAPFFIWLLCRRREGQY